MQVAQSICADYARIAADTTSYVDAVEVATYIMRPLAVHMVSCSRNHPRLTTLISSDEFESALRPSLAIIIRSIGNSDPKFNVALYLLSCLGNTTLLSVEQQQGTSESNAPSSISTNRAASFRETWSRFALLCAAVCDSRSQTTNGVLLATASARCLQMLLDSAQWKCSCTAVKNDTASTVAHLLSVSFVCCVAHQRYIFQAVANRFAHTATTNAALSAAKFRKNSPAPTGQATGESRTDPHPKNPDQSTQLATMLTTSLLKIATTLVTVPFEASRAQPLHQLPPWAASQHDATVATAASSKHWVLLVLASSPLLATLSHTSQQALYTPPYTWLACMLNYLLRSDDKQASTAFLPALANLCSLVCGQPIETSLASGHTIAVLQPSPLLRDPEFASLYAAVTRRVLVATLKDGVRITGEAAKLTISCAWPLTQRVHLEQLLQIRSVIVKGGVNAVGDKAAGGEGSLPAVTAETVTQIYALWVEVWLAIV